MREKQCQACSRFEWPRTLRVQARLYLAQEDPNPLLLAVYVPMRGRIGKCRPSESSWKIGNGEIWSPLCSGLNFGPKFGLLAGLRFCMSGRWGQQTQVEHTQSSGKKPHSR